MLQPGGNSKWERQTEIEMQIERSKYEVYFPVAPLSVSSNAASWYFSHNFAFVCPAVASCLFVLTFV